jgi:hypothetical protein
LVSVAKTTAAARGIVPPAMSDPVGQPETLDPAPAGEVAPWIVDRFMDSYLSWREEAEAVRSAYDLWHEAQEADDALAFAAYRAALDREEHAANMLCKSSERLSAAAG